MKRRRRKAAAAKPVKRRRRKAAGTAKPVKRRRQGCGEEDGKAASGEEAGPPITGEFHSFNKGEEGAFGPPSRDRTPPGHTLSRSLNPSAGPIPAGPAGRLRLVPDPSDERPRAGRRCRGRRRRSPSSTATGCGGTAGPGPWCPRAGRPTRGGRPPPPRTAGAVRGGAAGGAVRGRSGDHGRRRPRRAPATRRGDGRGGAGTASTDRGPARRPVGPGGSPRRPEPARPARCRARRRRTPRKSTPARPRTAAAASCSRRRVATSAPRSASGSQVPFEPSVSTSRWTSAPAAAHLASVAPQPNSTSSGWAPIASARVGRRGRQITGDERRSSRSGEVVGHVDVEGELGVAHDAEAEAEPPGLGGVAPERARAVGEPEGHVDGHREHGRAVVAVARHDRHDRAGAVASERREAPGAGQIGVRDRPREHSRVPAPIRVPRRRRRRASRDRRRRRARAIVPSRAPRTRSTRRRWGAHPPRLDHAVGQLASELGTRRRRRAARRGAPCPVRTLAPGSRRPTGHSRLRDARRRSKRMRMRMLPGGEALPRPQSRSLRRRQGAGTVYSAARTVLLPPLHFGMRWTIEGAHLIPPRGPGDPRQQPHLVPRPARARVPRRPPAPPGALPGEGRAVRQAAARLPVAPGPSDPRRAQLADGGRSRSSWRSTRSGAGECVAIFPEGTISLDLEPMAGKSGTARLAARAACPSRPSASGARTARCSRAASRTGGGAWRRPQSSDRPCGSHADDDIHDATDRIMGAIAALRRAGPRDLPAATGTGRRRVVAARARDGSGSPCEPDRRPRRRRRDGHVSDAARVAVVGAGSWGTAVAALVSEQRRHRALGAPARSRGHDRRAAREPRLPPRHRAPRRAAGHVGHRRGVRRRGRRRARCAVARHAIGADGGGGVRPARRCRWSAWRRASSRARCDA